MSQTVDLTLAPTPAMTAAQDRAQALLEKLSKMEPQPFPGEDDPHAIMASLMVGRAPTRGPDADPDADALAMLRMQDAMAVSMGRSLGYCGCPRVDYAVGERVRVREGLRPGFWPQVPGACGTVMEPNPMLAAFPVSPMQPKGIRVSWDDGTESLMYVTNLEPLSSQEGCLSEGGPSSDAGGADSPRESFDG